jgi:hypothetical protein
VTARRIAAAVCAWAAPSAACDATETGNPIADHRLALTARSSEDAVVLDGARAAGELSVEEAWVVLGDIRFVQSAACDSGGGEQADIPGPLTAELVARPPSLEFAVPQALYCRVRVPLERAEDSAGDRRRWSCSANSTAAASSTRTRMTRRWRAASSDAAASPTSSSGRLAPVRIRPVSPYGENIR